jgi:tetratricopeptide (TPR) repeat protein
MEEKNDTYEKVPVNPSEICQRAFELMQTKQYDEAEKLLNSNLGKVDDDVAVGLFHSSLGVLYKIKGEPKTAWKHYQRAEKLIPEDPALKIIVARLLIDQFTEFDMAIKKVKKVLNSVKENPVFAHQVYTTMGLAYLGKGQKMKSTEMLEKSMEGDFSGFVSAQNIDFNLVEALLRAGMAVEECKSFLEKARAFASVTKEETWVELIDRMLEVFSGEK